MKGTMEKEKKGAWQREKTLGAGGFGIVALWKNEVSHPTASYQYVNDNTYRIALTF